MSQIAGTVFNFLGAFNNCRATLDWLALQNLIPVLSVY